MLIVKWFATFLVIIGIIVIVNTMTFTREEVTLTPMLDDAKIDKHAISERLSQAIQFATISYMDKEQRDPQAFRDFHQFLKSSYPKTHEALELELVNGLSLLYRWKGSDSSLKPILFLSHQDVVPVDSESLDRWDHAPFSGSIQDGIIWGRGAMDIKSAFLGIFEAIEYLVEKDFQPKRDIYLAFGHDEEIGGREGAAKIAKLLKDRNVDFEFILDEGGAIVSDGVIPGVTDHVALVGIAEKGYVSLRLEAMDVGGHSSTPPKHTALGVIAKALVDIENNPFPANMEYNRNLFKLIGPSMSGVKKAIFANTWLTEPLVERILSDSKGTNASIRTTTAVTMASGSSKDNILPTEASAVINFRIMPGETVETVIAYVKEVIDNNQIEITALPGFGNDPSAVSVSDNYSFAQVRSAIYRVSQDKNLIVAPTLMIGATDSQHYTGLSDSIYRFVFKHMTPKSLKRTHGLNEQIKMNDYVDLVKFYRELILGSNET